MAFAVSGIVSASLIGMSCMPLTDFGFKPDIVELRCRVCGELITKTIGATLKGTPVKYGICRKYSHGASMIRT